MARVRLEGGSRAAGGVGGPSSTRGRPVAWVARVRLGVARRRPLSNPRAARPRRRPWGGSERPASEPRVARLGQVAAQSRPTWPNGLTRHWHRHATTHYVSSRQPHAGQSQPGALAPSLTLGPLGPHEAPRDPRAKASPLREAQRRATMPFIGMVTILACASARKKQKRRLMNSKDGEPTLPPSNPAHCQ